MTDPHEVTTTTPERALGALPAPRRSAASLLVVDDSAVMRAFLAGGLTDQGHEVREAEDGFRALEQCRLDPPDVLLLDIVMPGMSGLEVLDEMQRDPALRHIPVVCLTGRSDIADAVEALERGAHDYLRKPYEPSELLARISSALRVKRLADELRSRNAELERVSRTDGLTGLANRRETDRLLEAALSLGARSGRATSVLMIDVDHFKAVNDGHGHAVGDLVLQAVADLLASEVRDCDTVGRWGGEEFLAVLPMTGADEARALAERLCRVLAQASLPVGDVALAVTASIGACSGHDDLDGLLLGADRALYEAKAAGRACVRVGVPRG